MNNIFVGMIWIFIDFNFDVGASRIGLIPDFIGYILMIKGLSELEGFSDQFVKIAPYVKGMLVYSGICYAMDLLGVSSRVGQIISYILALISTIISFYISYVIIKGVEDIEVSTAQDLNSAQLKSVWKLYAVISIIIYVVFIIPALNVVCILAGFIIAIYYLYVFNKTKKLFYEHVA